MGFLSSVHDEWKSVTIATVSVHNRMLCLEIEDNFENNLSVGLLVLNIRFGLWSPGKRRMIKLSVLNAHV